MYLLQRPEDIPPRLTNRLNVRIAILTAVVVAAVAMVVLRLWSLQVLTTAPLPATTASSTSESARRGVRSPTATAGSWSTTGP